MYRSRLRLVLVVLATFSRRIHGQTARESQYPLTHGEVIQSDVQKHSEGYEVEAGAGLREMNNDTSYNGANWLLDEGNNIVSSKVKTSPLEDMLAAITTMQDTYFDVYAGTWPEAIDWTAAVLGTQVSGTLSSIVSGLDSWKRSKSADEGEAEGGDFSEGNRHPPSSSSSPMSCTDLLGWENLLSKYYTQTSLFYFGENAFALRNQAYDDMLWVVLGWLENLKFAHMYSVKHWETDKLRNTSWHGVQMIGSAAHRARIFYDLASKGWETELCGGGMVWNPGLEPYKNAITNELFTAASVAMYLYFPGDNNSSPFVGMGRDRPQKEPASPHDPVYLDNAVKSYKWLRESGMQSSEGLYQDGFHVSGWTRYRNGTIDPGTGQCDSLNTMVYTYNQGVILSASRGLWLATGAKSYLDDGHFLIDSVINATGWHEKSHDWAGLGRAGVLEEFCDHQGYCSQDGQTFKGIFFHHLAEFCRPLWPQEEKFVAVVQRHSEEDRHGYQVHLARCAGYGRWIEHNANAALKTRNKHGLFGTWWGVSPDARNTVEHDLGGQQDLPSGAIDHLNPTLPDIDTLDLNDRGRGRTVETQSGGLGVLRAHWQWYSHFKRST